MVLARGRTLFLIFSVILGVALFAQKTRDTTRKPASAPHNKLDEIVAKSIFLKNGIPSEWRPKVPYNPVIWSVIASLRSRNPERNSSDWQKVMLPPPTVPENFFFPKDISGYFRRGAQADAPLFIIFPGSFATSARGSFVNQTVSELDKSFNKPHILAFPGILTEEFLKGTIQIPWDTATIGEDVFLRLKRFRETRTPNSAAGLIGFSGGGALAIEVLGHAGKRNDKSFSLGGIAFSPVLHQSTTFKNIDSRVSQSRISKDKALTSKDAGNVWKLFKTAFQIRWADLLEMDAQDVPEFEDRFFNEFVSIDLYQIVESVGKNPETIADFGYRKVFVELGYTKDKTKMPAPGKLAMVGFENRTDIRPTFQAIRDPLFIYFSSDDPVLSKADPNEPTPRPVLDVLEDAKRNPNIYVFNPPLGAHTGALLDPVFPELLKTFFR